MMTGVDSLSQFQCGDLVKLDSHTAGVIIFFGKGHFHVLNMHGTIVKVDDKSISKRRNPQRGVFLDSKQNRIEVRDAVNVIDGPNSGRQGQIKHLFRDSAFVHSPNILKTGGIFVCKTMHLILAEAGREDKGQMKMSES